MLQQQPEPDEATFEEIQLEARRELFRMAARQVRDQVDSETWQAFWMTMVEGRGIDETAGQLGKSIGSVYAARSRVMRRLRDQVREFRESEDQEA